jgi:hypothetical protein
VGATRLLGCGFRYDGSQRPGISGLLPTPGTIKFPSCLETLNTQCGSCRPPRVIEVLETVQVRFASAIFSRPFLNG